MALAERLNIKYSIVLFVISRPLSLNAAPEEMLLGCSSKAVLCPLPGEPWCEQGTLGEAQVGMRVGTD